MYKIRDMTGQRFSRLVVLKREEGKSGSGIHARWVCECDCGNLVEVSGSHLRSGNVKSCGCITKEMNADRVIIMQRKRETTRVDGILTSALKKTKAVGKTSKYKGVYLDKKSSKWKANIMICYKAFHLGTFDTENEANNARLIAEKFLFEPFLEKAEKQRFLSEVIGFTDNEIEEFLREDNYLNKKIEKALKFIKAS